MHTLLTALLFSSFPLAGSYAVPVLDPANQHVIATGFLINSQLLLTAAHVAVSPETPQAVKCGKEVIMGEVIRFTKAWDLALVELQTPCEAYEIAPLAKYNASRGVRVTAAGYPGGRFLAVTSGDLTSYEILQVPHLRYTLITSAKIMPGNSGGPMFNDAGQIVALVVGRVCFEPESQPAECYGTAVPVSMIWVFLHSEK